MCGIAGIFNPSSTRPETLLEQLRPMLSTLRHRGPDGWGEKVAGNLALGHVRLSVIEPRGGRQPRCCDLTGNALVFNGEIYEHKQFHRQLLEAGARFRDGCDTETLFWLLQIQGVKKTLEAINGMYAFGFYHGATRTLHLARDRCGEKPLYYAQTPAGSLLFASEVKAILRHPAFSHPRPDMEALQCFLAMEYVPDHRTGFDGIRELPPGHLLCCRDGKISLTRYWNPARFRREAIGSEQSLAETLEEKLQKAVSRQLVADVPVGVFLSGGVDSSLVAALAKRAKPDIDTFTVRFAEASYDESPFAQEVAKHLGTRHHVVELHAHNVLHAMEDLIEKLGQPFADASLLPTYLLCRATRQKAVVALGGDGADELFRGYPNFTLLPLAPLMAFVPAALGQGLGRLTGHLPGGRGYMNRRFLLQQFSKGIGKAPAMQSLYWMSPLSPDQQRRFWRTPVDPRILEVSFPLPEGGNSPSPAGRGAGVRAENIAQTLQHHFFTQYLPHDILYKTDRASMYNSLEVRSPFLDREVVEFALTLSPALLRKGKNGKYILKRVASKYLPESIVARKKHGFALPVSILIKGTLKALVAETLLDPTNPLYGYLHYEPVQTLWREHQENRRDNGKSLWALYILSVFFRKHF